jgi:hypothetical protein
MTADMQQKHGTASEWSSANPVLLEGEIGIETDTNKFKIGDGSSTWANLTYFSAGGITTYTSGESLGASKAVYVKSSDGEVYLADNDDFDTAKVIGFTQESVGGGASVDIYSSGVIGGFSSLTVNEVYYLGEDGGITTLGNIGVDEVRVMVGVAVSSTQLLAVIGRPEYVRFNDGHQIGDVVWSANPSLSRLHGLLPFGNGPVSQSDFSELYAVVGDSFETAYTDLGYAASGAGNFYPAPPPQLFPRAAIPRVAIDAADFDDTNDRIDDGDSLTSGVAPFHIHRDGTAVRFSANGGTLPAGITEGTVYYARKVNSDQSIELWDTEDDAISGSGTQVTDFSGASGTVYMYNAGLRVADAFQGHEHTSGWALFASTSSGGQNRPNDAATGDGTTGIVTDGSNGTPRTTNETRAENILLYGYIKASHVGVTGEPVTAMRYSTEWTAVTGTDPWKAATFPIAHNLNTNISNLVIEFFVSSDGTDDNAQKIVDMSRIVDTGSSLNTEYGVSVHGVDLNNIEVKTGTDGIRIMLSSGQTTVIDSEETYYYKVVVYKPSVLASYTGSRNTIISIADATDQTVNIPPAASIDYPIFIKRVGTGDGVVNLSFEAGEDETGVSQLEGDGGYIELISDGSDWYIKDYWDYGSETVGDWEKFGDGTMKISKTITETSVNIATAFGNQYRSGGGMMDYTFPKTFANTPKVAASVYEYDSSSVHSMIIRSATSTTTLSAMVISGASENVDVQFNYEAIGRWK